MAQEQGEASEQLQARVAALKTENGRQAEEIARLLKKIRDLEEENDLLALDNEQLREKVNNAGAAADEEEGPAAATAATTSVLFGSAMARLGTGGGDGGGDKVGIFGLSPDTSYLEEGDGQFPTHEALAVEGCATLNPICCRLFALDTAEEEQQQRLVLATGGVDKFLTIYTVAREQPQRASSSSGFGPPVQAAVLTGFPGPLLSLDIAPDTVEVLVSALSAASTAAAAGVDGGEGASATTTAAEPKPKHDDDDDSPRVRRVRPALVTCMDGSHALVHLDVDDLGESRIAGVHKGHEKHAVVGRFSRCGRFFATGGHDKSLRVYDVGTGEEKKALFFSGNVEALAWVEVAAAEEGGGTKTTTTTTTPYLAIASRGVAHLVYLNCATWEKRTVSLNQAEWDEHVSFTVLSLCASPCGNYLLAATDKSRIIVFRVGSHLQLRNLYGHRADEYSNPRAVWDPSGKYVFCSSQEGNELVGWSLASERVVARLKGHMGIVRDVWYDAVSGLLLSVGYDKALRVWAP